MITKFIEATHGRNGNWGKFMVARFEDHEWARTSFVTEHDVDSADAREEKLLLGRGWSSKHILVFDLQTGEGAIFYPGGHAPADLNKHRVWVCPMFEPFLQWLYQQKLDNLDDLPSFVKLENAPFALFGHRRQGPDE